MVFWRRWRDRDRKALPFFFPLENIVVSMHSTELAFRTPCFLPCRAPFISHRRRSRSKPTTPGNPKGGVRFKPTRHRLQPKKKPPDWVVSLGRGTEKDTNASFLLFKTSNFTQILFNFIPTTEDNQNSFIFEYFNAFYHLPNDCITNSPIRWRLSHRTSRVLFVVFTDIYI